MNTEKAGLTGFQLKIIGIIFMLGDHIYEMFNPIGAPMWLHMAGRIVAPIFMFLCIEGYVHTRDLKKYMLRLLVGFYIMVIGNYAVSMAFPLETVQLMNNIFGDLFLGVFYIYIIESIRQSSREKSVSRILKYIAFGSIPIIFSIVCIVAMSIGSYPLVSVSFFVPNFFNVEEGIIFIPLIISLYYSRKKRWMQALMIAIAAFIYFIMGSTIQWLMVFSVIPILLYNGQKGRSMKYFFYAFYVIHIYVLYIAAYYIMR